ncbi:hypothetical protein DVH24_039614 [Malus domestica]|uniref:Uncharacterized protein n=1 Tax=Malus domestica TaxID=3750 RepID=A0A498I983_MALDO|nr:hypothetical protein DVH24_039614 [Malus domestica]
MNQTDRTSATVDCSSPKMRIREGQEISPDDAVEEIGSSTERSAVALEKRGKMLAAKPKFGIGRNRVEVQVVRNRNSWFFCWFKVVVLMSQVLRFIQKKLRSQVFKVYTESDTAKADAGSRTYAAVNEVWTQENAPALMVTNDLIPLLFLEVDWDGVWFLLIRSFCFNYIFTALVSVNCFVIKAGLKSMEKRKGILGSSAANANVVRKALADVSNVKSNSSRFVGVMPQRKLGFNGYIR